MRRRTKAVAVLLAVVIVLAFFFAPVAFWFTMRAGPVGYESATPVYRSFGCATVGYGDLYAPGWFGLSLGCSITVPIPS